MLTDQVQCTGCAACVSVCPKRCISMESNEEGFEYPEIDSLKCIGCNLCQKVCPVLNGTDLIGQPDAYAAYYKNEKVRRKSSSGGLFFAFAKEVIRRGGVVFGARFDKNFQVVHSAANTEREMEAFLGSKYVQSKIGDSFRQTKTFLEQGRLVYFSGTPCQIVGLKSFLGKKYENLICQDLICHGVPSPKVWEKYVDYREKEAGASTQKIFFRQKDSGWEKYSLSFEFTNGRKYLRSLDCDLYMRIFLHNICLRPSCYHCAFKMPYVQSDITLADFWGVEQVVPGLNDDKGISLALIHSKKGNNLFQSVSDGLVVQKVNATCAISLNPAAYRSVTMPATRRHFFEELDRLPFEQLIQKYGAETNVEKIKKEVQKSLKKLLKHLGLLGAVKKILHRRN